MLRSRTWSSLFLLAAALPLSCAPLQFRSAAWTITIDPADLSASAILPDGRTVVVSVPQPKLEKVSGLVHDAAAAHWSLQARRIWVTVNVKDNAFSIHFATDQPGKFAWPISAAPKEGAPEE